VPIADCQRVIGWFDAAELRQKSAVFMRGKIVAIKDKSLFIKYATILVFLQNN